MTPSSFDAAKAFTMKEEGGYSADRMDPGNWLGHLFVGCYAGVTAASLLRCYGPAHMPAITAAYMRCLPIDAAQAVYQTYWIAMGCQLLPPGPALSVMDFGFNAGERPSVRILQTVLGFPFASDPRTEVDGFCGPATIAAAGQTEPRTLISELHDMQAEHYASLLQFPRYGAGWLSRTARRRDAALAMQGPL